MPSNRVVSQSAQYRNCAGIFENKTGFANHRRRQKTQEQLNAIADHIARSGPVRINVLMYLYLTSVFSTPRVTTASDPLPGAIPRRDGNAQDHQAANALQRESNMSIPEKISSVSTSDVSQPFQHRRHRRHRRAVSIDRSLNQREISHDFREKMMRNSMRSERKKTDRVVNVPSPPPKIIPFAPPGFKAEPHVPISSVRTEAFASMRDNIDAQNELSPPLVPVKDELVVPDDRSNLVESVLERENRYVYELLATHDDILPENPGDRPATLIERSISFCQMNGQSRAALARQLQKAKGYYGEYQQESLPIATQKIIVRTWMAKQIFDDSAENFILKAMRDTEKSSHFSSTDLNHLMMEHAFRPELNVERYKPWILTNILAGEVPATLYFSNSTRQSDPSLANFFTMKLRDFDWGKIHAGLRLVHATRSAVDISIAEALYLGRMLLAQLKLGAVPTTWWDFFRLPALIRYAQDKPDLCKNLDELAKEEMVVRALIDYSSAHEKEYQSKCPFFNFNRLMRQYTPRPKLAMRIMKEKKCSVKDIFPYLSKVSTTCSVWPIAKGNVPLFNQELPDNRMRYQVNLPDIDVRYQRHVNGIADAYEVVDKLLLLAACNKLEKEHIDTFDAAHITRVEVLFSRIDSIKKTHFVGAGAVHESVTVLLSNAVEFLSMRVAGQAERIYALKKLRRGYQFERVDRIVEKYYAFLLNDKSPVDNTDFKLEIHACDETLKHAEQKLEQFIDAISAYHRNIFAKQLYDYGYKETGLQRFGDFILSVVPFYNCITEAHAGHVKNAAVLCSIDSLSLVPIVGELLELSIRLEQVLVRGGLIALRDAANEKAIDSSLLSVLKKGGKQFVQYGLLPASQMIGTKEIASLGLTAVRTFDPGIELTVFISRAAAQQLMRIGNLLDSSFRSLKKGLQKLTPSIEKLPEQAAADSYQLARLKGIDKELAVIRLEHDRFEGRNVFVQIRLETGEPFGRKYVLSDGMLEAIPQRMPVHLKQILVQGLGGKGAVKQGENWAKDTVRVEARLLRDVQQGITNGKSLAAFEQEYQLSRGMLADYLEADGKLTERGQRLVNHAEAGSSGQSDMAPVVIDSSLAIHSEIAIHLPLVRPYGVEKLVVAAVDNSALRIAYPVQYHRPESTGEVTQIVPPDDVVASIFSLSKGFIYSVSKDMKWSYDIDLNAFVNDYGPNAPLYIVDKAEKNLKLSPLEQVKKQAAETSMAQRMAVIKALGIDLDITAILNAPPLVAKPKKILPKILSQVWVGDKPLSEELLQTLEGNRKIANSKGYHVVFYLSEKSREINYENLEKRLFDKNENPTKSLNKIKIIEKASFYDKFKKSVNFAQYQAAIDGGGGRATNFASAADIFRLVVVRETGGLYMDVDDTLTDLFGNTFLMVEKNGFALGGLLESETLGMYCQFGTSMFGAYQGNTVIDKILNEIQRRYEQPAYQDFYQTPRPNLENEEATTAYQRKLFYLTGPDVFNTVLRQQNPDLKNYIEYHKLERLCRRPFSSEILKELSEKLPNFLDVDILSSWNAIGGLHSWRNWR